MHGKGLMRGSERPRAIFLPSSRYDMKFDSPAFAYFKYIEASAEALGLNMSAPTEDEE